MNTRIIKIKPNEVAEVIPEEISKILKEPAEALRNGEVIAFPTETVYGLGANATDSYAVKKIFELKGRPSDNPLIVHLHSVEEIEKYAIISNEVEEEIIKNLMPGPITIILKKKDIISNLATAGLDTVGIRVPYNSVAREVIRLSRVPVCAPSANISGKPSATDPNTVIEEFSGKIPFIIDSGRTHIGIESTVVIVKDEDEKFSIVILRPGFITKEDIEDLINDKYFKKPVDVIYYEELNVEKPLSPGQKYKHYAPKSHVVLVKEIKKIEQLIQQFKKDWLRDIQNAKVGVLGRPKFLKETKNYLEYLGIRNIVDIEWCNYDLIDCARNLFFAYRIFDKENTAVIFVESIEERGIGYSIMNRVKKSATYII